jgi:polyferredoxin
MLNKIVNHLLAFALIVIFTAASAIFWGISFPFLVLRQLRGEEKK